MQWFFQHHLVLLHSGSATKKAGDGHYLAEKQTFTSINIPEYIPLCSPFSLPHRHQLFVRKMVSFSCEACNDTLKKPKLDQHAARCHYAQFTCLDCNTTFQGTTYRAHTSCISEDQKYQKSVYKAPKGKGQAQQPPPQAFSPAPAVPAEPTVAPVDVASNANGKRPADDSLPSSSTDAEPSSKKSKKEKKKLAAAAAAAAASSEPPSAAFNPNDVTDFMVQPDLDAVGSSSTVSPADITGSVLVIPSVAPTLATETPSSEPPKTVHAFLGKLIPDLLKESRSLGALKSEAVTQAAAAGWSNADEVEKAFFDGIWVGGDKPKKMLVLNFERTAVTKVEKTSKKEKKKRAQEASA